MRLSKLLALLLVVAVGCTGCWDEQEITELAPIMGLGIDPGDRPGTIKVSVQVALPAPAGATGGTGATGQSKLRVITIEAATMFEAVNLLFAHTRREPFLGHLGFIVFGETMAKAGIGGVLGGMQGLVTIRGSVPVLVAAGSAAEVLTVRSGTGQSPGQDVLDILANLRGAPWGTTVSLNDVISTLSGIGSELALPIIELTPLRLEPGDFVPYKDRDLAGQQLNEVIITRVALFKRDRWVHELDPHLTQILILLRGDTGVGSMSIANPEDPEGAMAVQFERFASQLKPSFAPDDQVELKVKVQANTRLIEVRGSYDLRKAGLEPVATTLIDELREQIVAVIKVLQEHNTDALGVGNTIARRQPKAWSQLKPRWSNVFPSINVVVEAEVRIVGTSLIVKLFQLEQE